MWKNKRKTFSKWQETLPLWSVPSPRKEKARVNLSEIPTSTTYPQRRKQPCKDRLYICCTRASHRHCKARIWQSTVTKNEKRIRTDAFLFRQQDCVFHSRQSNLKGVKNAIELFEKRKDNRPWGTHRRQKIYRCQSLCRQEGFQKNHLRSRFQTNACGNGSPDRLTARAAWCFVCFAV